MNPIQNVLNFLRNLGKSETTMLYAPGKEPKQKTGPGFDSPMLQPSGTPQATPFPQPQQKPLTTQQNTGFRLSVPSDNGNYSLPPEIAQQIGNVFEPTKTATAAAQVLIHPNQQTRTKAELARGLGENWNRGENPEMIVNKIDIANPQTATSNMVAEGDQYDNNSKKYLSVDRGLYRINNRTFNGMKQDAFWRKAMERRGITSWADMEDPNKNIQMAYLILARSNWNSENSQIKDNPKWFSWYAAPLNQRQ